MSTFRSHGRRPDDEQNAKETVRLDGPGDLLAAIPYLLGFHPDDASLVFVGLTGSAVVLLTRIDLPPRGHLDEPGDAVAFWALFARALQTSDADRLAVIGYTDSSREGDLYQLSDTAPLPVQDLLRVKHTRWWSLDCLDPEGCQHSACKPWGDTITPAADTIAVPLIAAGAGIPGTRADLDRILLPGPSDYVDAVAAHLPLSPTPSRRTLYEALDAAHAARADGADGPAPLDPGQAAVLLQGLADAWVRDACLAWADDAAWWLWTGLVRAAPAGWIAPVATVIAIAAYRRGDGVTAAIAAEHALLDRPGYHLAHLVLNSLHIAVTPDALGRLITEATTDLASRLDTEPTA